MNDRASQSVYLLFPIQSCLSLKFARNMADRFVLHTDTDVEKFLDVERKKDPNEKPKGTRRCFWRFTRRRKRIKNLKICDRPNWIPTRVEFCDRCWKSLANSMNQQLLEDLMLRLRSRSFFWPLVILKKYSSYCHQIWYRHSLSNYLWIYYALTEV